MKTKISLALAMLLATTAAYAQLYKWVGPDGKVTYSDTPPPKTAVRVEQKNVGGNSGPDLSNLPYELAQAAKNHPVTFYTGNNCVPCDDGRNFLKNRGIPYSEKTVTTNEDMVKLRAAGGDTQLPVLFIGRNKQTGFEAGAWGSALTAVGYPASNRLPASYRQPPAEAAAPKPAPEQAANNKPAAPTQSAAESGSLPPPAGNAPPGFRF